MDFPPVTFTDNQAFYDELATKYRKHRNGFFILAPSGAGKTYFCKNQTELDWIDGDQFWESAGAAPANLPWWTGGDSVIHRIDQRSDVITMEVKLQGFRIMGASNYWLKPDAIVIPDWDTHVSYIRNREQNNYDGGAKSDALDQVKEHVERIRKWHTDHDVPLFDSIDEAVSSLVSQVE